MFAALGAGLLLGGAARADDPGKPLAVVFNVGAASDYEFRGVSQTNNRGEVYGEH